MSFLKPITKVARGMAGVGVLTLLLMGASCASTAPETSQQGQTLGSQVNLSINESVTFDDNLTVELTTINDSRCQPGVVCIWAGELSPVLMLSGGMMTADTEVILGTTTKPTVTVGSYVINLVTVTETTATIVIE